uniref:ORF058 n=1 Tax=Spodoptera frugiperda granulovirus TaxID=307454 RepID=A0A346QVX8_9BBAC|nr:ORF058 [Spodoptera frugiperda granulovirus]
MISLLALCFAIVAAEPLYSSSREAHALHTHRLCVDDCVDGVCVVDFEGDTAQCRESSTYTKHYRTVSNNNCSSNCVPVGSHYYCTLADDSSERCNRVLGLHAREVDLTLDPRRSCTDACYVRDGNKQPSCRVAGGEWRSCVPGQRDLLVNYRTDAETVCRSPCKLDTDDTARCYDHDGAYRRCTLNPHFYDQLQRVHDFVIDELGEFDEDGYRSCAGRRRRRQLPDSAFGGNFMMQPETEQTPTSVPYFNSNWLRQYRRVSSFGFNVERLARLYERNNPTVVTKTQPIVAYTVMPLDARFGQVTRHVPLVLRGRIDKTTIRFDAHTVPYAMRMHNTSLADRYTQLNSRITAFLDSDVDRYAEVLVVHVYDKSLTHKALAMRVRLYENDQLMDMDGNPLVSVQDNQLDNMLFTTTTDLPICDK